MKKIYPLEQAIAHIRRLKEKGEKIILSGGCFDIVHIGHIRFLEEAKNIGGKLVVMLEPDKKVSKLKGSGRPVFSQKERAHTLASLSSVDYVVLLPFLENSEYDRVISDISPDTIATTENDPILQKKKDQAESAGGKLVSLPFFKSLSSSQIARLLSKESL